MHPQAMQFETDDLSRKMPAAIYVYLDVCFSDRCPVVVGVGGALNSGHGRRLVDAYTFRKGYTKRSRAVCQLHPAAANVLGRTHAELFLTGYAQSSRRDAERRAYFRRSKMLLRLSLQQSFQAE